jgi:hypothetical protein
MVLSPCAGKGRGSQALSEVEQALIEVEVSVSEVEASPERSRSKRLSKSK